MLPAAPSALGHPGAPWGTPPHRRGAIWPPASTDRCFRKGRLQVYCRFGHYKIDVISFIRSSTTSASAAYDHSPLGAVVGAEHGVESG
jgi:hypothetical protein